MPERKVRAPQDMTPGNAREPKGYRKCNREQTACGNIGKGERVG